MNINILKGMDHLETTILKVKLHLQVCCPYVCSQLSTSHLSFIHVETCIPYKFPKNNNFTINTITFESIIRIHRDIKVDQTLTIKSFHNFRIKKNKRICFFLTYFINCCRLFFRQFLQNQKFSQKSLF